MASNNNSERKVFTVTWTVENIKYITQKCREILRSPTFIIHTMEETKWCLFIRPFFYNSTSKDGFFLGLERTSDSDGPPSIKIDCEYALLTADGCVARQCKVIEQEVTKNDSVLEIFYGISADEHEYFLPNGNLTVRCKMWKCSGEINNDGYCTVRTHIGVEKKTSIWSIRNFSTLEKGSELTNMIKSTLNGKPIVTLKFSVTGEDEMLQVSFISPDSEVESTSFSIKLYVLDINGEAVTGGKAQFLFGNFVTKLNCPLPLTKQK
ncbi:speckle-type POZ protein B [Caerostris extrusa]|uniref:Speckle-type POZ protein B n=1 Tax=Caerostris extrusa TaxID=172846 RepID=A0AAV4RHF4_CAEEX|nr:speckle-type POZ protein B [Caerostris extrusa]